MIPITAATVIKITDAMIRNVVGVFGDVIMTINIIVVSIIERLLSILFGLLSILIYHLV